MSDNKDQNQSNSQELANKDLKLPDWLMDEEFYNPTQPADITITSNADIETKLADITIEENTPDLEMTIGGLSKFDNMGIKSSSASASRETPPFRGGKRKYDRRVTFSESVSVGEIERTGYCGENFRGCSGGRFRPKSKLATKVGTIQITGTHKDIQSGAFERINVQAVDGNALAVRAFKKFVSDHATYKGQAEYYKQRFYELQNENRQLNSRIETQSAGFSCNAVITIDD